MGPRIHSPSEVEQRQRQFETLAAELDQLAATVPHSDVSCSKIEDVLSNIRKLGLYPKDSLVSGNFDEALQKDLSYAADLTIKGRRAQILRIIASP